VRDDRIPDQSIATSRRINKLAETVEEVDAMMGEDNPGQ
jgi:hypothetical protein